MAPTSRWVLGLALAALAGCGSDPLAEEADGGPVELPRLLRSVDPTTWVLTNLVPEGTAATHEIARDDNVTFEGHATHRLRVVNGNAGDTFGSKDLQPWEVRGLRRMRIRMTAHIKTEDAIAAATWIRLDKDIGLFVLLANGLDPTLRAVTGTSDFVAYSHVFDVPSDASQAEFGAIIKGSGTAWFGEVTFELVGRDVALTPLAFPQ